MQCLAQCSQLHCHYTVLCKNETNKQINKQMNKCTGFNKMKITEIWSSQKPLRNILKMFVSLIVLTVCDFTRTDITSRHTLTIN